MADNGQIVPCGVATPNVTDKHLTIVVGEDMVFLSPEQAYTLAGAILSACAMLALNRRVAIEYGTWEDA